MSNIFSNIGRGVGRGVENFLTGGQASNIRREDKQQQQLQQLGNILSGQSIPAFARPGGAEPSTPEQLQQVQLAQLATLGTPEASKILQQIAPLSAGGGAGAAPSAVREFQFFNKLSPEQQQKFIAVKRTDPLRAKGLTESVAGEVTIKPGFATSVGEIAKQQQAGRLQARREIEPSVAQAVNAAKVLGTQKGTKQVELAERIAGFPQLEKVTRELSELGKIATFTKAGQVRDAVLRQTNQTLGKAGIARAKYISKVDNEILPLLRQTFGSQFTQAEGESLKATLGDVNKSPAEKDAILASFMDAKIGQIESLQRELGTEEVVPTGQSITTPGAGEGTIINNPQTGQEMILRGGQWQPL